MYCSKVRGDRVNDFKPLAFEVQGFRDKLVVGASKPSGKLGGWRWGISIISLPDGVIDGTVKASKCQSVCSCHDFMPVPP